MKFGIFLPPFHEFAEPRAVVELAVTAERAGWDGLFLWDHMLSEPGFQVADPWITMAAVACETTALRLGAMVTPLARRRPWVVARQIATLDLLSRGRLTVGVGLGDDGWREFSAFGETLDAKKRASLLEEGLDLLRLFDKGEAVDYEGSYYQVHSPAFLPRPLQRPVPIWVAGRWPHRRPVSRAARFQGFFPIFVTTDPPGVPVRGDIEEIARLLPVKERDFDLVVRYAMSLAEDPKAEVTALESAGVTWILESFGAFGPQYSVIQEIVARGPAGRVRS